MGKIKKQILCEVSGTVGNVVLKKRGKVWYLACRPKKYRTPYDKRSIHNRKQFKGISQLGRAINRITPIKQIWQTEFPDCYSPYHEILKSNFKQFNFTDLSGTPLLTPHTGFTLSDVSLQIIEDKLIVKSAPLDLNSFVAPFEGKFITTASVLIIKSLENPDYVFEFHSRLGAKSLLEIGSPLLLTTRLNCGASIINQKWYVHKSWSVLIILDEKDNPVSYSELISWQSSIPEVNQKKSN